MMNRLSALLLSALFMTSLSTFAGCHSSETTTENTFKDTDEIKEGFTLTDGKDTQIGAILDKLGLEYGMIDSTLSGDAIVTFFKAELDKGRSEGYSPVIVVNDGFICQQIEYMLSEGYDVQTELKKMLPDAEGFLQERIDELESVLGKSIDEAEGMDGMGIAPSVEFAAIESASMFEMYPEIALVKLPTDKPWEAAIYIPFGGWNDCPAPLETASVLKLWYEKYGAIPAAISHDVLDMTVSAELSNDDALTAAKQMIAFDNDILFMGAEVDALADSLKHSTIWSFWWD